MDNIIYSSWGDHHLAYSDLYASSSIPPEFDPYPGSTGYFPIFLEAPPPSPSQILIMSFDMVRYHAYGLFSDIFGSPPLLPLIKAIFFQF